MKYLLNQIPGDRGPAQQIVGRERRERVLLTGFVRLCPIEFAPPRQLNR
jgi:hypothetical protein